MVPGLRAGWAQTQVKADPLMNVTPDPQLIGASAGGDREAIEQLLLQYYPSITRFARPPKM
jgi:hypothetical protein